MEKTEIIKKIEILATKTRDEKLKLEALTLLLNIQKEEEYKEKQKSNVENLIKTLSGI